MASIDDVLAAAKPRTETIRLLFDSDLAARHEAASAALAVAQGDGTSEARLLAIADDVLAVEAEIRAAEVEVVVQSIGKHAWSELLADHPPTLEHRSMYGRRLDHNPETFPYVAIAASVIEPEGMTDEKARALEEVVSVHEWDLLWGAVLKVNVGARSPGESVAASALAKRLRPSSEQREHTAPLAASSSDAA